jgi:predicted nuclease of predicted toxin-antitoxin system
LRFLIDVPVTPDAAPRLRAAGHDAVHAVAVGLAHATDNQLLDVARREGRIVITADLDYPRLLALQQAEGPGVILFRGGSYSDAEMLDLLDRVLARSTTLDLEHSIVVVDRRRIRRRPLPIGE